MQSSSLYGKVPSFSYARHVRDASGRRKAEARLLHDKSLIAAPNLASRWHADSRVHRSGLFRLWHFSGGGGRPEPVRRADRIRSSPDIPMMGSGWRCQPESEHHLWLCHLQAGGPGNKARAERLVSRCARPRSRTTPAGGKRIVFASAVSGVGRSGPSCRRSQHMRLNLRIVGTAPPPNPAPPPRGRPTAEDRLRFTAGRQSVGFCVGPMVGPVTAIDAG